MIKFKIGDKVIFNDEFKFNCSIEYDKTKSYTIIDITYTDYFIRDIFLDIDPDRPLYHERFLLDVKETRKIKLKQINASNLQRI